MRVHEVEVAGVVLGLDAQHAGGERAEQRRQVFFGHRLERSGRDVPHQDARRELDGGGSAPEVARVKISTSTPSSASRLAVSTM